MATRRENESVGACADDKQICQPARRHTLKRNWLRTTILATTALATLLPATGCMLVNGIQRGFGRHDSLDEFMVNYRNRAWSARAWLCRQHQFSDHRYRDDLEAGFRQGYEDVANGGSGCVPAVCPRSYWGWQYQSVDGQARMNAWFEGYPLGAQAAEQDGVGHFGDVGAAFPLSAVQPATYQPLKTTESETAPEMLQTPAPAVPAAGLSGGIPAPLPATDR